MPITITDYFKPGSQYIPYLMEDIYFKGGFRILPTIAARDQYIAHAKSIAWLPEMDSRKEGMLCHVIEDKTLYQLQADLESWEPLALGGGGEFDVENPLQFVDQVLKINPAFLVPSGGNPGDVLVRALDGTALWQTMPLGQGVRGTIDFTSPTPLESGGKLDIDFDMPATVMLIEVEVNAPDLKVEGWESAMPTAQNPYTFISSDVMLKDEGIRDQNGTMTKFRRYSFMSNTDEPVANRQYFSITNLGPIDVTPSLKIVYLALQ